MRQWLSSPDAGTQLEGMDSAAARAMVSEVVAETDAGLQQIVGMRQLLAEEAAEAAGQAVSQSRTMGESARTDDSLGGPPAPAPTRRDLTTDIGGGLGVEANPERTQPA